MKTVTKRRKATSDFQILLKRRVIGEPSSAIIVAPNPAQTSPKNGAREGQIRAKKILNCLRIEVLVIKIQFHTGARPFDVRATAGAAGGTDMENLYLDERSSFEKGYHMM